MRFSWSPKLESVSLHLLLSMAFIYEVFLRRNVCLKCTFTVWQRHSPICSYLNLFFLVQTQQLLETFSSNHFNKRASLHWRERFRILHKISTRLSAAVDHSTYVIWPGFESRCTSWLNPPHLSGLGTGTKEGLGRKPSSLGFLDS